MAELAIGPREVDWATCTEVDGCYGVQLDDGGRCLAHTSSDARAAVLRRVTAGDPIDFAWGVPFSRELLAELLAAAPRDKAGRPVLREVDFNHAVFEDADFYGVTFGHAWFEKVQFSGDTSFSRMMVDDDVGFLGAIFHGNAQFLDAHLKEATFYKARFEDTAEFRGAVFEDGVMLSLAHFEDVAEFTGALFSGQATFSGAHFKGAASFSGASFGDAVFRDVCFGGEVSFDTVGVEGQAEFSRSRFERDLTVKASVGGDAWFDHVQVAGTAQFQIGAAGKLVLADATCARVRVLELRAATVDVENLYLTAGAGIVRLPDPTGWVLLDGATLPQPLTVMAVFGSPLSAQPPHGRRGPLPMVLGLRSVDASDVVLSDVDLGWCLFAGAKHLDQLRIEGLSRFADSPRGWQIGWGWPPVWRWSRRQVVFEERYWRAETSRGAKRSGWLNVDDQHIDAVKYQANRIKRLTGRAPGPESIAGLYRQLRKAQEDAKNEPGAADFYYGEMEMRRRSLSTPWAERFIVWLYWLVAGYALRAWRALATLLVALTVASGLLTLWGLPQSATHQASNNARPAVRMLTPAGSGQSIGQRVEVTLMEPDTRLPRTALRKRLDQSRWWQAVWISVNAAVFRSSEPSLTVVGKLTEMAMRVLGPLLLALTALSVRNRIKR
jgi:uncharacterized protein YjbI with pentapeptide repeats